MFDNVVKDKFIKRDPETVHIINWANALTFLRIILTVPAVWLFIADRWMWGLIILALAVLTDWLDGFIARKCHTVSEFGKAFDPIADKILAVGMMILLVIKMDFPLWFLLTLFVRDFSISLVSLFIYRKHAVVGGSIISGKIFIFFLTVAGILWLLEFYLEVSAFAYEILIITYVMMIISWIHYLIQYVTILKSDKK